MDVKRFDLLFVRESGNRQTVAELDEVSPADLVKFNQLKRVD